MEMTFFQVLWFFLIFLLIAGYFVLDGFDLGAGVLFGIGGSVTSIRKFMNV